MRKTIFNLDNKINIKEEYNKIIKVLNSKCVIYKKRSYTYFDFINDYIFNNWEYRSTYIDLYEYFNYLGINIKSKSINENSFLNLIEFILNIELFIENNPYYSDNVTISTKCRSIIQHNLYLILDSMDYEAYKLDDKIIISKKNLDYDSLTSFLGNNIYELLLSYNNINNNGIKTKRIILNKIYDYICKDIDKYKNYNSTVFTSIKFIVTKLGIDGEIDKKYKNISLYKLRKYYDYCYSMMIYLIRSEIILKYRDEIRDL